MRAINPPPPPSRVPPSLPPLQQSEAEEVPLVSSGFCLPGAHPQLTALQHPRADSQGGTPALASELGGPEVSPFRPSAGSALPSTLPPAPRYLNSGRSAWDPSATGPLPGGGPAPSRPGTWSLWEQVGGEQDPPLPSRAQEASLLGSGGREGWEGRALGAEGGRPWLGVRGNGSSVSSVDSWTARKVGARPRPHI